MPSTEDIQLDQHTSFLLIGDSGTSKTTFLSTCPKPVYIVDCDKGVSSLAGKKGIDYDTFKELSYGEKPPVGVLKEEGFYEWGTAWPAIIKTLNEKIGRPLDAGTCKYQTFGVDSLTMLTECATTYILKQNGHKKISDFKDGRQFWGIFLSNMSELFSQLSGWPLVKVLTAHVKRDENLLSGVTEQLPLVSGQFAAKVSVYFDEVYFTDVKMVEDPKTKIKSPFYYLHTQTDATRRQARSRKFKLPTGQIATDYEAILAYAQSRAK